MEYESKNKETKGQPEVQPEVDASNPMFTSGQTIPPTIQTIPIAVNKALSVGQAQGMSVDHLESSSSSVTPSNLLGNSPSSQQPRFGPDFTFPHTPL